MACLLLERKFELPAAVLAAALLLLVAKANSQCPQGLPLFGDRDPNSELPDKIQAILPTYTFTCSGPVVQWGACVQPRGGSERYDIYFQVWRSNGVDGCYSIVDSNFVADGDPDVPRGCIVYDVPEDQRIVVEPGDVMGFYSDHNRDSGGIEVDTDVDLDVWYRTLSNPTQSDLEDSSLCIGATGDLNTLSTSGAPVITAVVDNSQCLLRAPLFGDRDGAPILDNSIQAIIPEYTFNCRGSVVQWGACVDPRANDDQYDIYFEVWRPTNTDGCYSLVGSNFVNNGVAGTVHNVRSCIVIDVPENDQVIVEPGDVVGFYTDHDGGTGGVELDEGEQFANLEVWYRSLSNPSQSELEANPLCVGNGNDLPTLRTGDAPVITAVVEPLSSQERSQSEGGFIGGFVGGMLAVLVLVLLVALVVFYKKRKVLFTPNLSDTVKSEEKTKAQQFHLEVDNPNYSSEPAQPKHPAPADTGETVYADPNRQRLEDSYDYPERTDTERPMSNVPLVERRHEITNGHYEWNIYVPTQEQRRAVTSRQYENIYAALEEIQKPQESFFEVSDIYWKPSSDPSELFKQLSVNKYREIPRKLIQTTEHLGSGQFGSVEKGIWQTRTGAVEIAVKTLKAGVSQGDEVRFLQEAAINGQFQHPNIVKLLGVVTVGEPVMIVLELLSNGDMSKYLNKHKPTPGELLPSDAPHMLLQFCQEVASGMEYLSQKAFVHRDLAARNILVAADRTCKISDFGMSRDLENESYYVSHGGKIPVKWTAPEALSFKKYSTASDVWSYGVLMFEIWSVGRKPFRIYSNLEAMELVESGVRLSPPPGCPKKIYKLMINCWHPDTSSRPSFTEVLEALSEPETDLLRWSAEDTAVHPQAAVLGAPLEAGVDLYPELQKTYA